MAGLYPSRSGPRCRETGGRGRAFTQSGEPQSPIRKGRVRPLGRGKARGQQPPRGAATRIVAAQITGRREVTLTLSEVPSGLDRTFLALGFPEIMGVPEGFVGGDPATAQGAATGLRTRGDGAGPFGEPIQDCALLQQIVPRRSESA